MHKVRRQRVGVGERDGQHSAVDPPALRRAGLCHADQCRRGE